MSDINEDRIFRDFKNVGVRKYSDSYNKEKAQSEQVFIGIKTPMEYGTVEGVFAMHDQLVTQIHDNLKNLILTNHGERVGMYSFGADLLPLTFEFVSQDNFDDEAQVRINSAVSAYMPFIQLEGYNSSFDQQNNAYTAICLITVRYSIPALNVFSKQLQVVMYII